LIKKYLVYPVPKQYGKDSFDSAEILVVNSSAQLLKTGFNLLGSEIFMVISKNKCQYCDSFL